MAVIIRTIEAQVQRHLFNSKRAASAQAGRNKAANSMEQPGKAFDLGTKDDCAAVSRYPKAVLILFQMLKLFIKLVKDCNLGNLSRYDSKTELYATAALDPVTYTEERSAEKLHDINSHNKFTFILEEKRPTSKMKTLNQKEQYERKKFYARYQNQLSMLKTILLIHFWLQDLD